MLWVGQVHAIIQIRIRRRTVVPHQSQHQCRHLPRHQNQPTLLETSALKNQVFLDGMEATLARLVCHGAPLMPRTCTVVAQRYVMPNLFAQRLHVMLWVGQVHAIIRIRTLKRTAKSMDPLAAMVLR